MAHLKASRQVKTTSGSSESLIATLKAAKKAVQQTWREEGRSEGERRGRWREMKRKERENSYKMINRNNVHASF